MHTRFEEHPLLSLARYIVYMFGLKLERTGSRVHVLVTRPCFLSFFCTTCYSCAALGLSLCLWHAVMETSNDDAAMLHDRCLVVKSLG